MKLSYRGAAYEYQPPTVTMVENQVGGKFRGLDWRFRNLKEPPVQLPTLDLSYRGVTYQTGQVAKHLAMVEATMPSIADQPKAALSVQDRARSMMMSHHRWVKVRQHTLLSRSAAEIGVTASQNSHWEGIQGKVHPEFGDDYDRSNVALS